jgi:hypothetical protein
MGHIWARFGFSWLKPGREAALNMGKNKKNPPAESLGQERAR